MLCWLVSLRDPQFFPEKLVKCSWPLSNRVCMSVGARDPWLTCTSPVLYSHRLCSPRPAALITYVSSQNHIFSPSKPLWREKPSILEFNSCNTFLLKRCPAFLTTKHQNVFLFVAELSDSFVRKLCGLSLKIERCCQINVRYFGEVLTYCSPKY